eukprot:scaffold184496_cov43-Prasinocladus_malaysianus.AAC.1
MGLPLHAFNRIVFTTFLLNSQHKLTKYNTDQLIAQEKYVGGCAKKWSARVAQAIAGFSCISLLPKTPVEWSLEKAAKWPRILKAMKAVKPAHVPAIPRPVELAVSAQAMHAMNAMKLFRGRWWNFPDPIPMPSKVMATATNKLARAPGITTLWRPL